MPRVKVVWTNHISLDDGYSEINHLAGHPSEWSEISEDELEVLRTNLHFLRRPEGKWSLQPHLLVDDGLSAQDYLNQAIAGRDKFMAERKRQEAIVEAQQKKRARTAQERKRAQYEKLKKEFEKA